MNVVSGMVMPKSIAINMCLWLTVLLTLPGCLSTLPGIPEPPTGTYRVTTVTTYNRGQRTFLLHVPPNYHADKALPLVVVLHGAFSTGRQTETETGFSKLADSKGFLVAYPEGIGLFGLLQHWNAGHCCGKAADDQVDDVGFLSEVIRSVRSKLAVDPGRIYMAGMSNGGMLTYRFAAERSADLAAAAVVSGAIGSVVDQGKEPWKLPQPESPVPIIAFHGLVDDSVPANGGVSPRKKGKRSYLAVADAIDFWRNADGCGAMPVATLSNNGSVKRQVWDNCRNGSTVEAVILSGWGHQWPAPWFTDRLGTDDPLRSFDATLQIWTFFSRFHRLNPGVQ
ncbi:MAG: alpha/beta hydrolase [Desulfuromonadales bacterium]|nr:alpha/beta hydrolase [Desulfuromonadales bacterium]